MSRWAGFLFDHPVAFLVFAWGWPLACVGIVLLTVRAVRRPGSWSPERRRLVALRRMWSGRC